MHIGRAIGTLTVVEGGGKGETLPFGDVAIGRSLTLLQMATFIYIQVVPAGPRELLIK